MRPPAIDDMRIGEYSRGAKLERAFFSLPLQVDAGKRVAGKVNFGCDRDDDRIGRVSLITRIAHHANTGSCRW